MIGPYRRHFEPAVEVRAAGSVHGAEPGLALAPGELVRGEVGLVARRRETGDRSGRRCAAARIRGAGFGDMSGEIGAIAGARCSGRDRTVVGPVGDFAVQRATRA